MFASKRFRIKGCSAHDVLNNTTALHLNKSMAVPNHLQCFDIDEEAQSSFKYSKLFNW